MSSAREALRNHPLMTGLDNAELVENLLANLDEAQCQDTLDAFVKADADKTALRDRLMADPALRSVVCPTTTWGTPESRYQVAEAGLAILTTTATKNDTTVDELVAAMVANKDGMQHRIELHKTDPRMDGHRLGEGYHAFKCAVRDALQDVKAEETKAARLAAEAKREAKWAAQGMERCARCGGAGGFKQWPGFTCYECGGLGGTDAK